MALKDLLAENGFDAQEISYLEKQVKSRIKVDPFATEQERERMVVEEYLADMQAEKDSILSQTGGNDALQEEN